MRGTFVYLCFIILSILFNNCKLITYDYSNTPLTFEEKNTIRVQDSIRSLLKAEYNDNYTSYSFGELITNKPKAFETLDSLYRTRKEIVNNKKYTTLQKDSLVIEINQQIESQKNYINNQKIYHTYSIDHIFLIKNNESFLLKEFNYILYPNYSVKEKSSLLSTTLTKKEKDLFNYFSMQNPLFETQDPHYNNQMDDLVYQRFSNALVNETKHKEELIHTILYCIEYIRKYNSFDEQDIAEGLAYKWLEQNKISNFIPKFDKLDKTLNNYEVNGYRLKTTNKKGTETILFDFDLNLVITNTSIK